MTERADVVVVGMGPGGEDVAGRLAEEGLDVVGIDAELLGGECPYWGCVPSKMMIRAADLLAEARRVPGMAGEATVRADWSPVASRLRDDATDDWNDSAAVERFEGKGGRFVRGWGRLDGPGRVEVDGRVFEAGRAVVVDVGTRAWAPPIEGLDATPYWTNREAVEAEAVPGSLAVLGGGAIGVELAQVFRRFGAEVTVLEGAPSLIGPEEPESAQLLAEVFADEGIDVRTGVEVDRSSTTGSASRSRWPGGRRWSPSGCWSPPDGAPTFGRCTPPPSGSTRTHARCRSTTGSGCPGSSGPGRSVTSPARARSPTSRCTRRTSSSTTCSGARSSPRTTTRCRG